MPPSAAGGRFNSTMTTAKSGSSVIPAALAAVGGAVAISMLMKRRNSKDKVPAPSKLRVYGFLPLPPDPDSSPACMKLVTFLKMTNADFEYVPFTKHGYKGSPKGKAPWAHGTVLGEDPLADSTLIMDALVRADPAKYDLDVHLSKEERAVGTFLKIMLEESCYFSSIMHVRWNTSELVRCTIPTYLSSVPALMRGMIARQVQKKMVRDLKGQGTGLLEDEEILVKVEKEISALSDFLGTKKYIMGDKISSYDATVYAYSACMIQGDWNHPITDMVRGHSNIVDYVNRMRNEFWSELQE